VKVVGARDSGNNVFPKLINKKVNNMASESLPITLVSENKKITGLIASTLLSTIIVFFLFFPLTFMVMFFHEAGHALFNFSQGVPVHFLYAHPFSFLGFVRPAANYYSIWGHASGIIVEVLISAVIFILLWRHRSFYTLPFLLVFPWTLIYDGIGSLFDILGHTGDYHNIMVITGWSPIGFYLLSLIMAILGIFFFLPLLPLLNLAPENRRTLFVLPAGMLIYTAFGYLIANLFVPDSPIDIRYHLAQEIIVSAYYRPIFMGAVGLLLAILYFTVYRVLPNRLPKSLRTETVSLSWKDLWYPALLFTISLILGLIIVI
jgi:hypothetical protein